ncbi:MAG: hypothetical protein B6D44_11440 [Ignavibacteriales bacterium UTCHB2]|jgi:hypothetical protein|nr:MAG: hypothetical protein BWY38_00211 [Ignavibacteria bacterium ADurb.Bin266]OQY71937.1 MAG: hypothetical protein B6D44_11440 [Ignavibacteriales bacterium UTCHB2]HQI39574.1 T9SS type A sorting domain-containing protein [Ignavibacteriaceae bacterium]
MKYTSKLLIIFLLFSLQIFSQEKSSYQNDGNDALVQFVEILKQTLADYEIAKLTDSYNNLNQLEGLDFIYSLNNKTLNKPLADKKFLQTDETYQYWDGVAWANNSKYLYSYDSRDNRVQYTYQNWNVTVWNNSSRSSYLYDSKDNQTEQIYQNWNGSGWDNNSKYIYTYDPNNNMLESVNQSWGGSAWTNSSRSVYTYNSFNKITQIVYQIWSGSAWTNSQQNVYTYDSNRNLTENLYQTWNGSAWANYYKYSNTYNSNNKMTEQINANWSGSAWVNSTRYAYTYDSNNNQTEYLRQVWDTSVWKNTDKVTYTFNAHNDIIGLISQSWVSNAWVNSLKYTVTYSSSFKMTEILVQSWDVSTWKDYQKSILNYDSNDNNTESISQEFTGGSWVNKNKSIFTYTGGHYPATITLNTSYTFADATQTSSYKMIGLPGANNFPITDILSGSSGANGDWRAFWDPGTGAYTEFDGSATFNFTPGKAFWVISKNTININQNVNTVRVGADNSYSIPLHSEWNLISDPFNKNISWLAIQNLNAVTQPIHFFQDGSYSNPDKLEPYKGYYFYNSTHLPVLKIPYTSASILPKQNVLSNNDLEIDLITNSQIKASISIGISDQANEGVDMIDIFAPPSQFCDVSINLVNNKLETNYKYLQKDYRPIIDEGQEFEFNVKNLSDQSIDMNITGMENFADLEVYLWDKSLSKLYDLKTSSSFNIRKNVPLKKFSVLIGSNEYILQKQTGMIPTEFSLSQNYPNPFNPSTMIRFALPKQSNVSLKIFNLLGQLVTEVLNNKTFEAGYHEIEFDGRQLASGVYLYSIEANTVGGKQYIATKKMLMMK